MMNSRKLFGVCGKRCRIGFALVFLFVDDSDARKAMLAILDAE
jgi:hypothetical protein